VYTAAERVFDENIPVGERILTYDICWAGCEVKDGVEDVGEVPVQSYGYAAAPIELQNELQGIYNYMIT
jgi:hypothetical protein